MNFTTKNKQRNMLPNSSSVHWKQTSNGWPWRVVYRIFDFPNDSSCTQTARHVFRSSFQMWNWERCSKWNVTVSKTIAFQNSSQMYLQSIRVAFKNATSDCRWTPSLRLKSFIYMITDYNKKLVILKYLKYCLTTNLCMCYVDM